LKERIREVSAIAQSLFPRYLPEPRGRKTAMLCFMLGGLACITLAALCSGAVATTPGQVFAILLHELGVQTTWSFEQQQQIVVTDLRLPRIILGMLTGACLAVAGAAQQGLFRNALADPALIGVSSGAALAAVTYIVLGEQWSASVPLSLRPWLLPVCAFFGGLLAAVLVYRIGTAGGRTLVATMLLGGIAINAIAMALSGMLIFVSSEQQLRELTFWSMGGLSRSLWTVLLPAVPLLLLPLIALPGLARALNAYALGEAEAGHLGFDTNRLKRAVIVLTALAVGASVALTGVIAFMGLVVPHVVRLLVGPDYRFLLPGSVVLGAALMLLADIVARTVVVPAELPIGIITSCIGGPFFLWLLIRRRAQQAI
jgi:iron complex transport system permease protein